MVAAVAAYARPGATVIVETPPGPHVDLRALATVLQTAQSPSAGRGVALAIASVLAPRPGYGGADRSVRALDPQSTAATTAFYRRLAAPLPPAAAPPVMDPATEALRIPEPSTQRLPRVAPAPAPVVPAQRGPVTRSRRHGPPSRRSR